MMITHDDKFLITAGKDGTIMIFEIKDRDAKRTIDGYSKFSEEILVTKNDLDEMKISKETNTALLLESKNANNNTAQNNLDNTIR